MEGGTQKIVDDVTKDLAVLSCTYSPQAGLL